MAKGRNITEMAEERLRRIENLLSEAQKVAKIGHWEWDIRSGAVTWSDEMFILFGYIPGAITPSMDVFMDTVLPEDRERVSRVIRQSLDGAGRYFMDRVAVLPDGAERIVHAEGEVDRDKSGAPLRMFAVVQDITESKRIEAELKASRDLLRALASYLDGAREEERTRIASEVHDELGQELTRLSIDLFGLTACIKRAHIQEEAQLLEKTDIISEGLGLLAEKVHTIAMELRPGILDQLGLTAAIEWQAGEFQKKNDIQCGFEVKGAVSIDNATSTALFRILQEALTNIVRHANAAKVDIRLWKEDGLVCLVCLEIADNGRGITDKELQSLYPLGLLGMKERARALGGSVDISGRSGTGTTVTVRIPARE